MSNTRSVADTKVVVVGAGPVGCVSALALRKLGYRVELYEARGDPRRLSAANLRSINLALSSRGISTIQSIDKELAARVSSEFVSMSGRMIHDINGGQSTLPYGEHGETTNSISRLSLNQKLVDEAVNAGLTIHFNHKLLDGQFKGTPQLLFEKEDGTTESVSADFVVGCDGSYSKTRQALGKMVDFNYTQQYIDHYYIEMTIPKGPDGFVFQKDRFHIWPRGSFMFIGMPNFDGSITGTLFAPKDVLRDLDTPEKFDEFFHTQFPDAHAVIGSERLRTYYENPRGRLMHIKCTPYHYEDKVIILGDAAHSVVPFYGQGLNSGLEDVRVLSELLSTLPREEAFAQYTATRKADLDAINDLSMANYIEMRDSVAKRSFVIRKYIDSLLSSVLGDYWIPLYTMVAFRPDVRYSEAISRGKRQYDIVTRVIGVLGDAATVSAIVLALRYRKSLNGLFAGSIGLVLSQASNTVAPLFSGAYDFVRDLCRL